MLISVLAFGGGILTVVSSCILSVLPFGFSRADQPLRWSGLPLLVAVAITFAAVASVATVAGACIVRANQIGRTLVLVIFLVMGLALVFPRIAEYLSRPFVRLGARVQQNADSFPSVGQSFLLGVAMGLFWARCAGPIPGLILTGAAAQGS
jgi:cytochrome c biogenesis protein CcdA